MNAGRFEGVVEATRVKKGLSLGCFATAAGSRASRSRSRRVDVAESLLDQATIATNKFEISTVSCLD